MKWTRVTRRIKCPVCDKPDWCIIAPDKSAVLCMRIASEREIRLRDGSIGWIHKDSTGNATSCKREYVHKTAAEINMDWPAILRRYAMDAHLASSALNELALGLGVSVANLTAIGIEWSKGRDAWAFPMCDEHDGFWEVCGIRMRAQSGDKWSVRGSRSGLFMPRALSGKGPLFICEGPTDTAAMLDLEFDAVGRVSCTGSGELIKTMVAGKRQDVVICADKDVPGQFGAYSLALDLRQNGRQVKVISPLKGKDMRAWKQSGATRAVVISVLNNTKWETASQLRPRVAALREAMTSFRTAAKSGSTPTASPGNPSGNKPAGVV